MPTHDEIETTRKRLQPEPGLIKVFRKYARGHQKGTLSSHQEKALRSLLGNRFCDNVCKRVLQEIRNRMRVARFEVSGESEASDLILDYLENLWVLNKMAELTGQVHWATLRDGNHVVGVKWDERLNRVVLVRENWWNGRYGIFIAYDDNDLPEYAVKDWNEGNRARRTVWYPDRIERFVKIEDGWDWLADPITGMQGPVPWLMGEGEPLGLPIVHFANMQVPNDDETADSEEADPVYGASELDGGILGLQDEINDIQRDITAAARYTAFQMVWATGVAPEDDGTATYHPEPGAMFNEPDPQARFGHIPAGSIRELKDTLVVKHQTVARMSSVPFHLIGGEWPSGDAIMRAERPLTEKVETIASSVGPAWSSVAHKATRISNAFGDTDFDEDLMITTVFYPPDMADPLTLMMIAEKEAPFVSVQETLRTLGKSPKQIARILDEIAQEKILLDPLSAKRQTLMIERERQNMQLDQAESERLAGIRQTLADGA